ncbi:hypothetical protein A5418_02395 [Geobacillus subterraneus]|nr:hypothetical protein A5418_02395 [Geobacillus subterraneus]
MPGWRAKIAHGTFPCFFCPITGKDIFMHNRLDALAVDRKTTFCCFLQFRFGYPFSCFQMMFFCQTKAFVPNFCGDTIAFK